MRMKDRGGNWFDEASFNPEEPVFAEGGLADILQVPRKGYAEGTIKSLKQRDYETLEDEGNLFRYLMMSGDRGKMSPPDNWLSRLLDKKWKYHPSRDDFETMQKERFMYGAPTPHPNVFKQIFSDIKRWTGKKAKGGLAKILEV